MRFLVDMNLSPLWVPFLSTLGFESIHWSKIGAHSAPDKEILRYARSHGYAVLTHDLDFGALLHAGQLMAPSVVQIRADDVLPSAIGDAVVRAIRAAEAEITAGALVTVDPVRQRIRLLPFA